MTCNVLPRNNEIEAMREYVGQLKDTGVDALIVSDIGVMMMARQVLRIWNCTSPPRPA